jgi:hypothetical protein
VQGSGFRVQGWRLLEFRVQVQDNSLFIKLPTVFFGGFAFFSSDFLTILSTFLRVKIFPSRDFDWPKRNGEPMKGLWLRRKAENQLFPSRKNNVGKGEKKKKTHRVLPVLIFPF